MIDIHCHILPCVDDGPRSMPEALAMARLAAADGINRIVATPHVDGRFPALMDDQPLQGTCFASVVAAINWQLKIERVPLIVLPGAEISSTTAAAGNLRGLGLNNTRYLLIEMPATHLPADAATLIFRLIADGHWPILAHPERNPSIIDDPRKLFALRKLGARVQITAASLTAAHNRDVGRCAVYLLKKNAVDLVASDAHSATSRPPVLSAAFKAVSERAGVKRAIALLRTHPMAVLRGAAIHGA